MKRIPIFTMCLFAATLIWSCGPSKKLKASMAKSDSLTNVVNQQNNKINAMSGTISDYENQISQLKKQNQISSEQAADCIAAKEAIARKMVQLNEALAAEGTSMQEIRRKAAEALNKFANAGVDVTYKNGLVYISMQDKLLFSPGSARLGKDGISALSVVAQVLNDNPNLKVYVVGNTDSIAITKGFKDNWSLSTERANSVVRVLRDNYMVSPARITAAGKSKYDPVADNSTLDGRAKNRRTDIILNPDLSRLWDLIDKQQ
jgi:chemotaxis protein MotB